MVAGVMNNGWLVREGKRTLRSLLPRSVLNWREEQYFLKYGEVELHIIQYLCDSNKDSIDVGANDGCYTHVMRKFSRKVYAFEPIPWLAQNLEKKFPHGVVIKPVALSGETRMGILHMPLVDGVLVTGCSTISAEAAAYYPGNEAIPAMMDRLDNIYSGEAGFIKIDVEGGEEDVLAGAGETITRCRPKVLIEVLERLVPGGGARVAAYFRRRDYRGYFIYNGQLLPMEQFDPATMQRPEDEPDLKASLEVRERFGKFIYNFLYIPAEEPAATLRRIEARLRRL